METLVNSVDFALHSQYNLNRINLELIFLLALISVCRSLSHINNKSIIYLILFNIVN